MSLERKTIIRCAIYTRKSSEEGLEPRQGSILRHQRSGNGIFGGQARAGSLRSLKSLVPSIAFRFHSRKVFMRKYRRSIEHGIARAFHKSFGLIERCLLLGLMVAVSLAQQSPSIPAWIGVVRTAAGEPVAGAKVTVYTPAAKENLTVVTGTDGRFAIAGIRLGPHNVSVRLPGRG